MFKTIGCTVVRASSGWPLASRLAHREQATQLEPVYRIRVLHPRDATAE